MRFRTQNRGYYLKNEVNNFDDFQLSQLAIDLLRCLIIHVHINQKRLELEDDKYKLQIIQFREGPHNCGRKLRRNLKKDQKFVRDFQNCLNGPAQ